MRVKFDYIYCVIIAWRDSFYVSVSSVKEHCISPVATVWFKGEEYTWEDRML